MKYLRLSFIFCLVFLGLQYLVPIDDTDISRWDRSGMSLYIDHGTGCHYLAGSGFFGKQVLIKRTDAIGMHVCKKEDIRKEK